MRSWTVNASSTDTRVHTHAYPLGWTHKGKFWNFTGCISGLLPTANDADEVKWFKKVSILLQKSLTVLTQFIAWCLDLGGHGIKLNIHTLVSFDTLLQLSILNVPKRITSNLKVDHIHHTHCLRVVTQKPVVVHSISLHCLQRESYTHTV